MTPLTPWQIRGGVKAVALHFGISEAAVSQWQARGIPEKRAEETARIVAELLAKSSKEQAQ